ncbi:carbamoyltransferase N-terminal domain-containing protein, partial [Cutibacterium acnes]
MGPATGGDLPAPARPGARRRRRTAWTIAGTAAPSGFERAAILTIDGIGETAGTSLAKAIGTRIQTIETFEYPHSIGFIWEVFSGYLGFSHYDASKVMGLAAYGDPDVYREQFQSIM